MYGQASCLAGMKWGVGRMMIGVITGGVERLNSLCWDVEKGDDTSLCHRDPNCRHQALCCTSIALSYLSYHTPAVEAVHYPACGKKVSVCLEFYSNLWNSYQNTHFGSFSCDCLQWISHTEKMAKELKEALLLILLKNWRIPGESYHWTGVCIHSIFLWKRSPHFQSQI